LYLLGKAKDMGNYQENQSLEGRKDSLARRPRSGRNLGHCGRWSAFMD
jgi:hypothetical protein